MTALRYTSAALLLAEGAIHLQQWLSFISTVPYVGPLFLLNAPSTAVLALALAAWPARAVPAALGGVAVTLGAIVSLLLALGGGFLGYQDVLRTAVVLALAVEGAAVLALGAYLAVRARSPRAAAAAG